MMPATAMRALDSQIYLARAKSPSCSDPAYVYANPEQVACLERYAHDRKLRGLEQKEVTVDGSLMTKYRGIPVKIRRSK